MSKILNISDAASIALHAMVILATDPCDVLSATELASMIDVSEAHLSKVLQRLSKAGLVDSVRGPKGGYKICDAHKSVTLLDVYTAIEGPIGKADCLLKARVCDGKTCILGGLINHLNKKVGDYLSKTRIIELAKAFSFSGKEQTN